MLGTVLNFAATLAGLIAAWRWYQTTTIRPPTELPYGGPTTIDTGPLVAFIKDIARLNASSLLDRICRIIGGPCDYRPLLRAMSVGDFEPILDLHLLLALMNVQPVFIRNGF
jgi:hypothetical protein